jgi:plasmid stabilization system protein ParE
MAKRSGKLSFRFHPRAEHDLSSIWSWNAERYSAEHADSYVAFLLSRIKGLLPQVGRRVPGRGDLRYQSARRGTRGDGHIVVFRSVAAQLEIRWDIPPGAGIGNLSSSTPWSEKLGSNRLISDISPCSKYPSAASN